MKLEEVCIDKINALRAEVNKIDDKIFYLINKRNDIAKKIGKIKKENNLKIRNTKLEKTNKNILIKKNPNLKKENVVKIKNILIKMAVEEQTNISNTID